MKFIPIIFLLFIISSCQVFSYRLTDKDLQFSNWLDEGENYIFVSNKNDTADFTITEIITYSEECKNWPETCGNLFLKARKRTYNYKKTTKDSTFDYEFLTVSKSREFAETLIRFEGCDYQIYPTDSTFNNTFKFNKDLLKDVSIFSVNESYEKFFQNNKNAVNKMWWSRNQGLIQYRTKDSLIWKRLPNRNDSNLIRKIKNLFI